MCIIINPMDEFKEDLYDEDAQSPSDEEISEEHSDVWDEDNSDKTREPDFSDVIKKVRNPWKLIIFLVFSAICWYYFYYYGAQLLLKK